MGKIQERMAAYDNISKVLELMRKKKAPVKSQRKLDKKPKKLDVEKFLPKDRPKTVLDEKINSRRIKQALEEEYQRVHEAIHEGFRCDLRGTLAKPRSWVKSRQRQRR